MLFNNGRGTTLTRSGFKRAATTNRLSSSSKKSRAPCYHHPRPHPPRGRSPRLFWSSACLKSQNQSAKKHFAPSVFGTANSPLRVLPKKPDKNFCENSLIWAPKSARFCKIWPILQKLADLPQCERCTHERPASARRQGPACARGGEQRILGVVKGGPWGTPWSLGLTIPVERVKGSLGVAELGIGTLFPVGRFSRVT